MTFSIVAIILLQYVALILLLQSFDQVFLCAFVRPSGVGGAEGESAPLKVFWQCALFLENPLNMPFLKIFNLKY